MKSPYVPTENFDESWFLPWELARHPFSPVSRSPLDYPFTLNWEAFFGGGYQIDLIGFNLPIPPPLPPLIFLPW